MKSNVQIKSEDLPPAAEPREWFVMLFGGSSTFVLWQIDAAILCFPRESGATIKLGNFLLVGEYFLPGQKVLQ
jgi:hypothetical protein